MRKDQPLPNSALIRNAGWFGYAFKAFFTIQDVKTSSTRISNLALKRSQKLAKSQSHSQQSQKDRNLSQSQAEDGIDDTEQVDILPPFVSQEKAHSVGPPTRDPETEDDSQRVASISDPSKSSAGSKLYYACRETATQNLGNKFCCGALDELFETPPSLDWVTGRRTSPVFQWRDEYLFIFECRLMVGLWSGSSS